MNATFPFGLEPHLTFYLAIYVLTWVLHAVFMSYVLAGSIHVAGATLFPGSTDDVRSNRLLASTLREWLPFALSAAITAGVAPLLFVQILYRQQFYTSNLLLGWRWLMVVPILIVAFYLLYVLKSKRIASSGIIVRAIVVIGIAASFLFVAFCWTANHLLSVNEASWPEVYVTAEVVAPLKVILPRLGLWVAGTFPVMAILAGWQLLYYSRKPDGNGVVCSVAGLNGELRHLARLAVTGLGLAIGCAFIYRAQLSPDVQSALTGPPGMMWLVAAAVGCALQAAGWFFQMRNGCFCPRMLSMISAGVLLTLTATASPHQSANNTHVITEAIAANTKAAFAIGGFGLFVVCAVITSLLMAWCIRLTKTGRRA